MAMGLWAAANRNTNDEEYGAGFAINCVAWALGLLWTLHSAYSAKGVVPLAAADSGKASGA